MTDVVSGLVIVDKPAGWTSHDVVGRVRRLAGTRKVGHSGTLDPMATGVLVLGVNRATRLLGHLTSADKEYLATIRLGQATVTDDAEGEVTASTPAAVERSDIEAAVVPLTGDIEQVPSAVSAIKVDGVRSYARVRSGESVRLKARPVRVSTFEVGDVRTHDDVTDVDVRVVCSSGTYVRALARDLGDALGVGGHLTKLRRIRVGGYGLDRAHTLESLAEQLVVLDLDTAVRDGFPSVDLTAEQAAAVRYGRPLPDLRVPKGHPTAVFDPDGHFLALYEQKVASARPVAVFV
ncbi:MAG TPA: tRNA pseudouridine(55) synthase TruB [Aeromicrobium sp.]|nr:tRNA pseudouridine(55) synthase TruB [Aeromicrobium sp.]